MTSRDYTGITIGKLTAIRKTERRTSNNTCVWEFKCECGGTTETTMSQVTSKHTQSCGCLQKQRTSETMFIHGLEGTRLYRVWSNMKTRCSNPNVRSYKTYGSNGINVCGEWKHFNSFKEWAMTSGYKEDLQIDRIDNNKGYNSENCRWVTIREQQSNRSNTKVISIGNCKYTLREVSEITGISLSVLRNRRFRKQELFKPGEICKEIETMAKGEK